LTPPPPPKSLLNGDIISHPYSPTPNPVESDIFPFQSDIRNYKVEQNNHTGYLNGIYSVASED
jgi:hypothetical protein